MSIVTRRINEKKWSPAAKLFVIFVVITGLASLLITSWRMIQKPDEEHLALGFLFITLSSFGVLLALFGVVRESKFELGGFMVTMTFFLAYTMYSFFYDNNDLKSSGFKTIRFYLTLAVYPINMGLALKCLKECGWVVFKMIGGDIQRRKIYNTYSMHQSLLLLDLMWCFAITSMSSVMTTDYLIPLIILMVTFSFSWTVMGYVAIREEMMSFAVIWLIFGFIQFLLLLARVVFIAALRVPGIFFVPLCVVLLFFFITRVGILIVTITAMQNFKFGAREILIRMYEGKTAPIASTAHSALIHSDDDEEYTIV